MPALIILAYAAAVYLLFLAVLGYAAGFFAGRGVPALICRPSLRRHSPRSQPGEENGRKQAA